MTDKVPPPKWGDYNSLGNLYAALGDPRRLEMLALLRERGPLSVGDIAQATELRQSNVSTKLAYLKFNRLVAADPQGRLVY